jgi:photosystem II CP47 chlorophyll apoprotein
MVAPWHLATKPSFTLARLLRYQSLEAALSSSLGAVLTAGLITQASFWFVTGASSPIELFGPTRFHWDSGFFTQTNEARVAGGGLMSVRQGWEGLPEKLVFYDYIGCNPAKGGLFRSGPMIRGDGLASSFSGHAAFSIGSAAVSVRRNPAFFEGFPVLLIDAGGRVRADIPFRRAESRFSIEQSSVVLRMYGGLLSGSELKSAVPVKNFARKAINGEIFNFRRAVGKGSRADGVFRSSVRGWYSFSHLVLAFLFWFGHLWHASRSLFGEIWCGVRFEGQSIDYGASELLGHSDSC